MTGEQAVETTLCPRCANEDVLPFTVQYLEELFGEIPSGSARPEYLCTRCGHEWSDMRLPVWWPPVPVDDLDPFVHDTALRELNQRTAVTADVVHVLRNSGLEAAGRASRALRAWLDEHLAVNDAEPDTGLDALVVPMDGVVLASVLTTAAAVTRSVEDLLAAAPDDRPSASDRLDVAVAAFERADTEFDRHRFTDFSRPAADDEEEDGEEPDPDGEFAAAVRSGPGGAHPAVPEAWDDHLAEFGAHLFTDGSAAQWARYVWAALAATDVGKIETECDVARARLRLAALDVLRSVFLARALDDADEPSWRAEEWALVGDDPRIDPFFLGVLATGAGIDPDLEVGCEFDEGPPRQYALTELVRAEGAQMAAALRTALGTSRLVASLWASSVTGAQYPVNDDALDILLNHDLTWTKHRVFAWIDEGMSV